MKDEANKLIVLVQLYVTLGPPPNDDQCTDLTTGTHVIPAAAGPFPYDDFFLNSGILCFRRSAVFTLILRF
jgi:hypothetical protein